MTPDALVIGAGPAGLMAADMISAAGYRVVIADAMPSPARKFLMAGKSGLNVSRDQPLPEFVSSYFEGGPWLAPILDNFGPEDVKVWLDSHGIEHFTGSSKRIFPQGMKASPLLRSWLGLLAGRGVELKTRWRWDDWDGESYRFLTPEGDRQVQTGCAVLAVGGASWSRLGSTGSWTQLFDTRHIQLSPFKPTNVGCRVDWSSHMERHFGQPVKPVRMQAGSAVVHGEFVVTRKGLEGGGIYLLSNRLRDGETLILDLLPHMERDTVSERLGRARGRNSFSNHLRKVLGLSPVKIALFRECFAGDVSDIAAVADALKALRPRIAGPLEIDEAISTGGGVPETALDGNLMLRAAPGVFCAGEMLDWDAPTGGYLLTACLATGRHAGMAAAGWLEARVATQTPACQMPQKFWNEVANMRLFSIGTRGVSLILAMLAWMMVAMPLPAQDEPAADAAPAATEETAPTDAGADAAEAPAEEAAPEPNFAEQLLDPEGSNEEFELRLIPLTAPELEALANEWLGIVRNDTQAVVEERIRSRSEDPDVAAGAAERVVAQTEALKLAFDKFNLVINNWIKKGGDEAVINEFQSYRSAVLIDERRTADFQAVVQEVINWAISPTGGIALLIDVGIVVGSFVLLFMAAGIISRFARRMLTRVPNVSTLLKDFLGKVFFWVTIAIGLMVVLSMLGVDVTPMLALLGGASFIIAFAMQDTLSNLAAGLMIMINRPFDVGDYVDIGGVGGTVRTVSIVSTTVTTPDNQVIVVPNSNVWGNVITNVTSSPTRRVDMTFGIGYSDSIEKTQRVLEEIAAEHPLVLDDPEPTIRVSSLSASSVDFIFRPWTRGEDYWTVFWDMQRIVKERFDAEDISIPFPQTDMHIKMHAAKNGEGQRGELPFSGPPNSSGDYSTGDEGHNEDDRGA